VIDLKGMALETVIFTLVALFSVVILLFKMNSMFPYFMGKSFCKVYQIIFSLPLPKNLKPNIPGCCLFPEESRVFLERDMCNPGTLSNYIEKCWEKSQEGRAGQTFICYEIFLESVTNRFGEDEVKNFIDSNELRDSINWKIGYIEGLEITVIIKYNSTDGKIEVI